MSEPQDPNEHYDGAYPPPGYGQEPGYGQQPGYSGYPGYQSAPGQPPGAYPVQPAYPPQYGAPYSGYPPVPPRLGYGTARPGMVVGSAVLSFVTAGLLVISAIVLFAAASTISKVSDSDDFFDFHDAVTELTVDGVLDLVAAAVLIVAGVQLLGRRRTGLILTLVGQGLTIAYAIYWLARTGSEPGAVSTAVLFVALAAVAVSLAIPPSVRTWLARTETAPRQ